jgi:hypothetical protein
METFQLLYLAACWRGETQSSNATPPPLTTAPGFATVPELSGSQDRATRSTMPVERDPVIRAAAAQLVFASRTSERFITPQEVTELEAWTGRGVLEAVTSFQIEADVRSIFGYGTYVSFVLGLSLCTRKLKVFGRISDGITLSIKPSKFKSSLDVITSSHPHLYCFISSAICYQPK